MTRPFFRFRSLMRLNAWPLPGFTISLSMIEQGSPSIINFKPALNWLVLNLVTVISHYANQAVYDTLKTMAISSWQQELREIITAPDVLLKKLKLPDTLASRPHQALQSFPMRITDSYLAGMQAGNPEDPLFLQVFPDSQEDAIQAGFSKDPVGDRDSQASPGLLHKYHGRVLLITTGACAIHCRYCFRQHFPYHEARPAQANWEAVLDYIKKDPSITEVILSGGDPLILPDNKLAALISDLESIPHLKRLRIHSRIPLALPSRITDALMATLSGTRLTPVVVLHANHPHELSTAAGAALEKLKAVGASLLNQSVLLKNINDNASTLAQLSEALFTHGVLPYYLHMLDRVQGTAHFLVPDETALSIITRLRAMLPGYLVPRLVREVAGQAYKTPLL